VRRGGGELEGVARARGGASIALAQPHLAGDDERLDRERMLVRRDHGAGRPVARHDLVIALRGAPAASNSLKLGCSISTLR
jgi:hypothetical protein